VYLRGVEPELYRHGRLGDDRQGAEVKWGEICLVGGGKVVGSC